MDQAGISWAGYGQGMPAPGDLTSSGDYAVDQMPFAQFSYVYDNTPAYLEEHLLPQSYSWPTALQDPSTFPEFAWVSTRRGPATWKALSILLLAFPSSLISQFTNQQYNVAAGDQFLQQDDIHH